MGTANQSPLRQAPPVAAPAPRDTHKEPVRLLKVLPLFACGGTEGQVMNLVREIDREQFDVQFACLRKWGFFLEEIEQRNIPVSEYRIKSFYKPGTFWQQLRLATFMREQKIEIVHSYNFYANTFAVPAARMAGVPSIIASIRDRGVYLSPVQQKAQKWACKMAHKVLVNADSIRDWLVEDGYQADRIQTIPNGIDISRYRVAPGESDIRREWDIPASAPLVVMLSRLNPQKGVDDFLRAAAQVSQHYPEARFLVVGEKLTYNNGNFGQDMDYHQQLKQISREMGLEGRVIFTGHRSDVPALLAEAKISVLPSHSEGLSNTLLESMAAGLPVVATRVGGNPELIQEGVNGLLVEPKAPEQLAEAISRILGDEALAGRFSRAARQRAEDCYSMQRMVDKTQDIYFSMLREHAAERP